MAARSNPTQGQHIDERVKRIYDHLYANASVRTPSAIAGEVGKLIRTAAFMEGEASEGPAFELGTSRRRALERGEAAEVKAFAKRLREKYRAMKIRWGLYGRERIRLSDADLAWCCAQLDGLRIASTGRDVFGDAVEIFRTSWAKQNSGQFFTDGRVTRLALTLLDFDPRRGDDLIDICCGTGGFLLAGLDRIAELVGDDREAFGELAKSSLRGQEVDPEIREVANASLSSRIGGDVELVRRGDSLSPAVFGSQAEPLREGAHLCAAANPPFGTKITVKDPRTLAYYDLSTQQGRRSRARAPDILLLERNLRMLRPGVGRLAIIVPYQILSGPQTRYIRDWLLRQAELLAVVDLPSETFQPHTGTKTALLLLRRRDEPLPAHSREEAGTVFMSTPRWVGHDRRGKTLYRQHEDGTRSDEVLSDIEDVGRAYGAFVRGEDPTAVHEHSFVVDRSQIGDDPDLRFNARYFRDGDELRRSFRNRRKWRTVSLGEVTQRIFFPPRFKRNYVDPGEDAVPFLGGANISQLHVVTSKFLSSRDPNLASLQVEAGWILVTRSGSTGIVSSVPPAWEGLAISEHVIRIVPDPEKLHPAWLQAYLRSSLGQRALARGVFGSVIDEITPEYLASLSVPLPRDESHLRQVVESFDKADEARQEAIAHHAEGLAALEALF